MLINVHALLPVTASGTVKSASRRCEEEDAGYWPSRVVRAVTSGPLRRQPPCRAGKQARGGALTEHAVGAMDALERTVAHTRALDDGEPRELVAPPAEAESIEHVAAGDLHLEFHGG